MIDFASFVWNLAISSWSVWSSNTKSKSNCTDRAGWHPKGVGLITAGSGEILHPQCDGFFVLCFKLLISVVGLVPIGKTDHQNEKSCETLHVYSQLFCPALYLFLVFQLAETGCVPHPFHFARLCTKLESGVFPCCCLSSTAKCGISILIGNKIAGRKVKPVFEVVNTPPVWESEMAPPICFPPVQLCMPLLGHKKKRLIISLMSIYQTVL